MTDSKTKNNLYEKIKKWSITLWPAFFIWAIIIFLYANNNYSWIFNFETLDRVGDQRLYIQLSDRLLNGEFKPHIYSLGYSIFLSPFVFFLKTTDWTHISRLVVIVQSLIIVPISWILLIKILSNKIRTMLTGYTALFFIILAFFFGYELFILSKSADPIVFNLFWGLIPYSEPWGIFLLLVSYFLLIRLEKNKKNKWILFALGIVSALAVMVRIIFLIILLPVFLYFLLNLRKKFKNALLFSLAFFVGYLPQLIYNKLAFKKMFFSSYVWDWEKRHAKYADTINALYNKELIDIFNFHYFKVNLPGLFEHYIHFVLLAVINLVIIFLARRGLKNLKKLDLVFIFGNICSIFYLAVYLYYWWSALSDCIDRFLLPLLFFSLLNFFYALFIFFSSHETTNKTSK